MSRRNRWTGLFLVMLSVLISASCATHISSAGAYEGEPGELVVENRGWETVTVYAVRGASALRIGTVSGLSSRTFKLNPAVVGPPGMMQLKAERRISGEAFTSSMFDMSPGTNAQWTIETTARLSHLMVR